MKQRPEVARNASSADSDGDTPPDTGPFKSPLPGGDEVWSKSPLGQPEDWPSALQAYCMTLASFTYPAAIFWGQELIVLHNEQWPKAGGVDNQGQPRRGTLKADAFNALSSSLRGGMPTRVASHALLQPENTDELEDFTVLISPLFNAQSQDASTAGESSANGVLAQLIPRPKSQSRRERHSSPNPREADLNSKRNDNNIDDDNDHDDDKLDLSELGTAVDKVPLDQHPFFHRFAEMLPTGLAILDHKAQAIFVNQNFYVLTTHQGDDRSFRSWPQSIHPEDYDRVMGVYQEAFQSQKQVRTEFRALGKENPWRLLLLTPLGDENLQHVSLRDYGGFICSIVDISSEKSAEISERQAAREATQRREQQERFIDMISHEIRNPLSAVLHCSEDVEDAVRDPDNVDFAAIKEAVETINMCIAHQKTIVDDVLSFSKLDASMLTLTARSCNPSEQLAQSLKMFVPTFRKQHMEFKYRVDPSYNDFGFQWVVADVARMGQVLINLVSNAIKFTARATGEKRIEVSVGASHERPTSYPPNVVFFGADDSASAADATSTTGFGDGEVLYILVAVKDTGIGISEEGQAKLFERFRQATPKTSEIYGGSGLGLNISRKICHLHGGDIGVSSKEGAGSTFGFFFKARKASRPPDEAERSTDKANDEAQRDQIKRLGHQAPEDHNLESVPDSLNDPPVESTPESTPQFTGHGDERYQKTNSIVSSIEGRKEDRDPGLKTPKQVRTGGQHNQSQIKDKPTPSSTTESKNLDKLSKSAGQDKRAHVLLVEDNVINQKLVLRKLEAKGYSVTIANNGREAVDAARKAPKLSSGNQGAFNVMLMDGEMPIMDGNTATRAIRELETKGEIEHVPIVGVTANVRGAQQDAMLDAGMDAVVSKPYRIEDLIAKIDQFTGAEQ